MKTYSPKSSEIVRKWHLFDAGGQVLGRLASQVAVILMNKHRPTFIRHMDAGDHVVIINAKKIVVTGNKAATKVYRRHSGYPGGMKVLSYQQVQDTHPERILISAISGMLPDNKLKDRMLKHLHVYSDESHPYQKQFKS